MPHIMFSRSEKYIRGAKKDTDNAPTNKIEQVTSGMKQSRSFQILSFCKKFKQ